jgi:hypothetical protein
MTAKRYFFGTKFCYLILESPQSRRGDDYTTVTLQFYIYNIHFQALPWRSSVDVNVTGDLVYGPLIESFPPDQRLKPVMSIQSEYFPLFHFQCRFGFISVSIYEIFR